MTLVIVFAFDPVAELDDRTGLLPCASDLAERLIAEHRVERPGVHVHEALRYMRGSLAHAAARDELRRARSAIPEPGADPPSPRRGRPPKAREDSNT
jgi:hypothetical protein